MAAATTGRRWVRSVWCLVALAGVVGVGAVGLADEATTAEQPSSELPRYRFQVGQELVYEQTASEDLLAKNDTESGTGRERHSKWTVWPVRKNDDGSWRLLLRTEITNLHVRAEGDPEVSFENDLLGYCDLQPDGSFVLNETLGRHGYFKTRPDLLFVRLPCSPEQLAEGWEYTCPVDEAHYTFRAAGRDGDMLHLTGPVVRPTDVNYQVENSRQVDFDLKRGLSTRLVNESKADWQINPWHTRTTIELTAEKVREPSWIAQFDQAASQYIQLANERWRRSGEAGYAHTKHACQTLLEDVRQRIVDAQQAAQLDETRELYEALLALHDREAEWAIDEAANREELYASPPVDWQTTDLDGNSHSLADNRGQVVLLDFWYRGCGHCIEALPKVKRLAALYKGQDFVVLGINSDDDDQDARYVIDKFGLHYPTLRAGDIPQQYHVSTWPTFIVLDQNGRIADYVDGNAEDLFEHVKGVVDGLLANPPSAEPTEPAGASMLKDE